MLTVGSLFSGIGGLDLGLERAGMSVQWQVEIDEYCNKVLEKHWPNVVRHRDVRSVGSHNLTPVDVICGGFPCQDISGAGKRAGIREGTRSGLWYEYRRIISELRPRYVIVENVAALLSRGIGIVCGDLAEIGYDAEWRVVSAADVGAPHLRNRVFIVAHPAGQGFQNGGRTQMVEPGSQPKSERCSGVYAEISHVPDTEHEGRFFGSMSCAAGSDCDNNSTAASFGQERENMVADVGAICRDISDPAIPRFSEWRGTQVGKLGTFPQFNRRDSVFPQLQDGTSLTAHAGWWAIEPSVGRVAHGVPARVDRLKGLGNAVVPQVAQYVGECVVAHAQSQQEAA